MVPANGMEISLSFCKKLIRPIKPYHHDLSQLHCIESETHLSHHPTCLDNMMDFTTRVSRQIVHAHTTVSYPCHNPHTCETVFPIHTMKRRRNHTQSYTFNEPMPSTTAFNHNKTHALLIMLSNFKIKN
ncbi:hypothetical protein VNO78_21218 [Psophocarpus tetragonolobus]|uniref:Uncharacterized protein n=1 Tax=Psophocarpus tetragonolobus TaxID=3891 RepID=A0AAN9SBC0_PSOTE